MCHRSTDTYQGCPVSKEPMLTQAVRCVCALVTTQNSYHLIFTFSDGNWWFPPGEKDRGRAESLLDAVRISSQSAMPGVWAQTVKSCQAEAKSGGMQRVGEASEWRAGPRSTSTKVSSCVWEPHRWFLLQCLVPNLRFCGRTRATGGSQLCVPFFTNNHLIWAF